jgi:hypothetical protein
MRACFPISILILAISCLSLQGQTDTAWIYTFGGQLDDACNQIRPVQGNGFIVCGTTNSFGTGNTSIYAIKIDSSCTHQWSAAFGGRGNQAGYAVTPTMDKGFAFVGFTNSYGNGGYDVFLVKTDSAGRLLWQKTYGGTDWDFGYSIKETTDGGFLISGLTFSYGAGGGDVYVIRTNQRGDTLWTKTYGGTGEDIGNAIAITGDSLYTIAGSTTSFGSRDTSIYLIQLDTAGNLKQSKTYGCRRNNVAYTIAPTRDNGFIMMGSMDSVFAGIRGQTLLKTDGQGNQKWIEQITNGPWQDIGKDVVQAPDGSFLIAGTADGGGFGSSSMHIMHYDSAGNYLAGPSFGGNATQCGNSVARSSTGAVVFGGATTSYGNGNNDVFLVRFKNDSIGQNPRLLFHNFKDSLTVTGIGEQKTVNGSVRVFPNPMVSETGVYVQGSGSEKFTVKLYDTGGRCQLEQTPLHYMGHGLYEVHLQKGSLATGTYIYEVSDHTEVSYSGKLNVE